MFPPQQQQERRVVGGADSPSAGTEEERVDWLRETPIDGGRTGSPGAPARQKTKRPGSAPSARCGKDASCGTLSLLSVVGGPYRDVWMEVVVESVPWPRVTPARNMQHVHHWPGTNFPALAAPPPLLRELRSVPTTRCMPPHTLTCPSANHPKPITQRPSALEPRSFGNNRPSSASPHRLGGGVTGVFRPGSGGTRAKSARGAGVSSSFLPPAGAMAPAGPQSAYHSHLFSPAALSATYGPLSEAARKVRGADIQCNPPSKSDDNTPIRIKKANQIMRCVYAVCFW